MLKIFITKPQINLIILITFHPSHILILHFIIIDNLAIIFKKFTLLQIMILHFIIQYQNPINLIKFQLLTLIILHLINLIILN